MSTRNRLSPFKFLDPYDIKDKDIFFGRDALTEKLYHLANKNKLILVYGPLGSGKTSLVQCGLSNRFDVTDWFPILVRRKQDINQSLIDELFSTKALGGSLGPELVNEGVGESDLIKALKLISSRYLRPVYLIFDQFEELLILGSKKEQLKFLTNIKDIYDNESVISCNIIFIMREEYFAWLDSYEQLMPEFTGFSNQRLRVEPMGVKEIEDVIIHSCNKFKIKIEESQHNIKKIISVLSSKNGISLPYLQVYFDQLWKADYERTDKDVFEKEGLTFTTQEIEDFGKIGEVLERFLNERKSIIEESLYKVHGKGSSEDIINNFLDSFVTDEGTKLPIFYDRSQEDFELATNAPEYLKSMPKLLLKQCLESFERSRILRDNGTYFELAHDTLAALINEQRTEKQRRLNEIRRQITSLHDVYETTHAFLTEKHLNIYREWINQLNLNQKLQTFYDESEKYIEAEKQLAIENIKINEQKKAEEIFKAKESLRISKTRKIYIYLITGLALLAIPYFILKIRSDYHKADVTYGMAYIAYKLDSIDNKEVALRIVKLIYNRIKPIAKDTTEIKLVENRIMNLLQTKEIQSKTSWYRKILSQGSLDIGDFALSPDGGFIVYKDSTYSSNNSTYKIIKGPTSTNKSIVIKSFTGINYSYFLNKGNLLLLAKSADRKKIKIHPDSFIIFDCNSNSIIDSFKLSKGRLFDRPYIFETNLKGNDDYNFDYSFRVRYTSSGTLIIPCILKFYTDSFLHGILVHRPNFSSMPIITGAESTNDLVLSSNSKVFMRSDNTSFMNMTGSREKKNRTAIIYDNTGQPTDTIHGINNADFDDTGCVIYSKPNKPSSFFRRFNHTETLYNLNISPIALNTSPTRLNIETNGKVAYIESKEGLIVEALQDSVAPIFNFRGEQFVGANQNLDNFITATYIKTPNVILMRSTSSSKPISSMVIPHGIKSFRYNKASGQILVCTKKDELLLLDKKLKRAAGFQLTTNDQYGFSQNGNEIFYLRDNYLCIHKVDKNLIDYFDSKQLLNLLEHDLLFGTSPLDMSTSERLAKYKLAFPSNGMFFE